MWAYAGASGIFVLVLGAGLVRSDKTVAAIEAEGKPTKKRAGEGDDDVRPAPGSPAALGSPSGSPSVSPSGSSGALGLPSLLGLSAASGAPSASVAVAPSAAPTATVAVTSVLPSAELRKAHADLETFLRRNDIKSSIATVTRIGLLDPDCLRESAMREAVITLANRALILKGDEGDQVFSLITNGFGTRGIDLLFELVTTRGGSKAAEYAARLLERPEVRARGSEGLRVAWELRSTKECEAKRALFPRVKLHGDWRSRTELLLISKACGRGAVCCMPKDKDVEETLAALAARGVR